MTDAWRRVLVLTPGKPRLRHDNNSVDRSHLVESIPEEVGVIVDTEFQRFKHPSLFIPKATNKCWLNAEERVCNRYISSQRILVEQAIGGMKRYGTMHQILRSKLA